MGWEVKLAALKSPSSTLGTRDRVWARGRLQVPERLLCTIILTCHFKGTP